MSGFDPHDPHGKGEMYAAGAALESATGVVILIHGRGASAEDILGVSGALMLEGQRIAFLAPEAVGGSWYPNSFLAERSSNEPWVSSALRKVASAVDLAVAKGVARERIVVGGFSQGACLATEFVATHPARYGGLIAWTGGLIGAPGSDISHAGALGGMPTLQSSGDPDPHVPWSRVEESARVLEAMGAEVMLRRYPGKPHSVSEEEIALGRGLVERAFAL
ncbi:MAG: phospholipase [Acidobacteria bacterium]|nr:phospholipase [Acidobacteriota bacterium]